MKLKIIWLLLLFTFTVIAQSQENILIKSIQEFGVLPENNAATNKDNLQKAIDWAALRGAALFVEPSEEPYNIDGGIILKQNVSLIGVHGPVGRGTRHPQKVQPVGSVFKIVDEKNVFITVEGSTQIKGIQFWYANQTISDPEKIINYPPTIQVSKSKHVNGVTLSSLTFYGEYTAMDFVSNKNYACEQILFEHCYGYPLSGEFIKIDLCYDIPRILHCHVNPANRRYIEGQYSKKIIDAVVAKKTFTYSIERTDNAQVMDVFTFGAYGGIYLGEATYGQMTNFNFDCVTVGIHKLGNNSKNRNWQIAQGSIIANTGDEQKNVHPIIIEGKGHTSLINVEAFSGSNGALTSFKNSQDFLLVKGNEKLTVSLYGCRMNSYLSENPFTIENPKAIIQATDCIDKYENPFNMN
ncbi:MAG: hypothetical protein KF816_03470 [Melioribacteraceae bacterium]|nr:hypothetical protein [Melioribacteraceae bacterium]